MSGVMISPPLLVINARTTLGSFALPKKWTEPSAKATWNPSSNCRPSFGNGFSLSYEIHLLGTAATELGSDRSTLPSIFNVGAILLGIAALVATIGFRRAPLNLGAHPILA
jgi:hypothetical protein